MRHPSCETAFFLTIPIVLKTSGWSRGQDAAVVVKRVATVISAIVVRVSVRPDLRRCQPIQSQAPITVATASCVTQPWAWSSTAIEPPATARMAEGRTKGSTQQAVQGAATSAAARAVAATFLPVVFGVAQPQP